MPHMRWRIREPMFRRLTVVLNTGLKIAIVLLVLMSLIAPFALSSDVKFLYGAYFVLVFAELILSIYGIVPFCIFLFVLKLLASRRGLDLSMKGTWKLALMYICSWLLFATVFFISSAIHGI